MLYEDKDDSTGPIPEDAPVYVLRPLVQQENEMPYRAVSWGKANLVMTFASQEDADFFYNNAFGAEKEHFFVDKTTMDEIIRNGHYPVVFSNDMEPAPEIMQRAFGEDV